MAESSDNKETQTADEETALAPSLPNDLAVSSDEDAAAAEPLGLANSNKYVHGALLGCAVIVAFLSHKTLGTTWNHLAEWPPAVRAVPWLIRFPEDERESLTLGVGAFIGLIALIQAYRKPNVRLFAEEVARELGKVTWPNREAVTNGTLVVILASAIATVYVAVLDRLWSFITTLVYGA